MPVMETLAIIQAAMGLAGGIQKGIAAAKQNKMGKEYGKTQRPEYQIPPSLQKATDMARANLNPAVNGQLLQEIGANSAGAINRAGKVGTSTADMLAAIGGINANENAAKRQLFGDNQSRKDMMLGNYMQQLSAMAGQENKAWEWNKAQPYLNAQEAAQALHQSSAQNAAGAMGDLAGGIAGGANSIMQGKQMDNQKDIMSQMMKMLGYGGDDKLGKGGIPEVDMGVVNDIAKNYTPKIAPSLSSTTPKLGVDIEDNSLTKGLTELLLPKPQVMNSKSMGGLTANSGGSGTTQMPTIGDLSANTGGGSRNILPNLVNLLSRKGAAPTMPMDNGVADAERETMAIINNTNIPAPQRIAADPIAPVMYTTTTGQVLANGKKVDYSASEKLLNNDNAFNVASGGVVNNEQPLVVNEPKKETPTIQPVEKGVKNTPEKGISGYNEWKLNLPENLQNRSDKELKEIYAKNPKGLPTTVLQVDEPSQEGYLEGLKSGGTWKKVNNIWEYSPSEYVLSKNSPEEIKAHLKKIAPDAVLKYKTLSTHGDMYRYEARDKKEEQIREKVKYRHYDDLRPMNPNGRKDYGKAAMEDYRKYLPMLIQLMQNKPISNTKK